MGQDRSGRPNSNVTPLRCLVPASFLPVPHSTTRCAHGNVGVMVCVSVCPRRFLLGFASCLAPFPSLQTSNPSLHIHTALTTARD